MTAIARPSGSAGLRLLRTGLTFPYVPSPPIHCRSLGDRLCVAAVEGLVTDSRIVLFDRDGQPASTGLVLPFLLTGLDLGEGWLVLTSTRPDGSAVVAGLDIDEGTANTIADLPMPEDLTRVAEPMATVTGIEIMWQSGFDRTTLWSTTVSGGSCGPPRPLELGDLTSDSALAGVGEHVALARVHGVRQQLELMWLVQGEIVDAVPVAEGVGPATPSVASGGDAAVVAWSSGEGLRVSRVEMGSGAVAAELSVPLQPGRHLRSCDVIAGGGEQAAVIWHAEQLGDPEPLHGVPGRQEPSRVIEGWAAALDVRAWHLSTPVRLSPPGTVHHVGGWVGDRLLLVHGDQQPVITVLEDA